jgi:nicotinamidase-related amidase
MTMNRDLGVWTYEDCALVLIDYQEKMFEVIRSETSPEPVDLNVRLLAKAFEMPIVLFRDWATPLARPAREVINWYFTEVPKLTDEVGVAEAEEFATAGAH